MASESRGGETVLTGLLEDRAALFGVIAQIETLGLELLDVIPRHQTAHGALLVDVLDVLRGTAAPRTDVERLSPSDELSPSELRVLRFLPTNLTRPEIARELYLSINTVNTHIRNIYAKLGARGRSSAVERARELRLLSTGSRPSSK